LITPILHRILIKPEKVENVSKGGILLAIDEKREQAAAEKGTVVLIGSTAFKDFGGDPNIISVGDKVYFAKYAGKTVEEEDGTEYILLNDEDIIGVINE